MKVVIRILLKNFVIIGLTLLMLAFFILIFWILVVKITLPYTEKAGELVGNKLKGKYMLLVFEWIFIITIFLFPFLFFIIGDSLDHSKPIISIIILFLYVAVIIFVISIISRIKLENKVIPSLFEWLRSKKRVIKLFEMFGNIASLFSSSMSYILILYLVFLFMFKLKWSPQVYFISFLFLPIVFNFWIYFRTSDKTLKIRRSIAYCLILVLIVYKSYSEYMIYLQSGLLNLNWMTFFLYTGTLIFFALERLVKEFRNES